MAYDAIVVGGGIVGLATALKLQEKQGSLNVMVIEKEPTFGHHQTGHNSGVIHSGVYYKPGSLKALNCTKGYQMLTDFCDEEEIPYELCGKVVVATEEWEIPILENIHQRGIENGLTNLKMLDSDELKTYEPYVRGVKALHVPQTGIMDYKLMAERMAARIEQNGGVLASGEAVEDIQLQASHTLVKTSETQYETKLLVNCAGLYSDKIAKLTHPDLDYRIIPFRGEYFNLKPEAHYLVNNLIYPVPDPNFPFLGVHFTREIDGNIEAGPNAVFAFEREGYQRSDFNLRETMESLSWPGFQKVATKYWRTGLGEMYRSFSKSAFTKALQKLVPDIRQHHLDTGGAGVRAQACDRHGGLVDDFVFFEDEGVVHVLNAPSPAATSCLSIGDTVADKGLGRMAGEKQVISEQESHNSG